MLEEGAAGEGALLGEEREGQGPSGRVEYAFRSGRWFEIVYRGHCMAGGLAETVVHNSVGGLEIQDLCR